MGLSYQVEPWRSFVREAQALWPLHWQEVGADRERMHLDPDLALFDALDAKGGWLVVTVRTDDGTLAGYHISLIEPLLHYRSVVAGKGDAYWIHPQVRGPRVAVRLFQEVERASRARGAHVLYDVTKLSLDQGRIFEAVGYRPLARQYIKWLG